MNLLSELGHYLGGTAGQGTVNSAMRLYFSGVDQQIIKLAAGKKLPDGTYPSVILASDDVTIDSRNGLMWQRTNFCATPYPYMPPSPTAPDDVRNGTAPFCIYNFVSTDLPAARSSPDAIQSRRARRAYGLAYAHAS